MSRGSIQALSMPPPRPGAPRRAGGGAVATTRLCHR
jgi:hypothetical protein